MGHDMDSSMVFTSLPVGNYHRLLKAGSYNLTFSAEGYQTKTIQNLMVSDKSTVRLDVQLYNGYPAAAFTASETTVPVGGTVQFFDTSLGNPTARTWTFEGGNITTSTVPEPIVTYNEPGTWDVSLFVQNAMGSNEISMPDYITVTPDYYIGVNGSNTCFAGFYDSQGPELDYERNENLTTTFVGTDEDKVFRVHFTSFDVEPGEDCSKDALYVYDGPDDTWPLIGKFCGNTIPEDILTSIGGGAITFVFVSDETNNYPGWSAELTCDSGIGVFTSETPAVLNVYPNPSNGNGFYVESSETILNLEVIDLCGKQVYQHSPGERVFKINALINVPGVYILKVTTTEGVISQKMMVTGKF
jgi:PKD repeat protein